MADRESKQPKALRRSPQRARGPVQPTGDVVAEARRAEVMSSAPDDLREDGGSWDQRVRERAYAIWLTEGQPEGREADHWNEAERELAELLNEEASGAIAETPGDAVKAFKTRS